MTETNTAKVSSALLFASSSISISLFNKSFLQSSLRAPIFLALCQSLVIAGLLSFCYALGVSKPHSALFQRKTVFSVHLLIIVLCFVVYLLCGITALSLLNVTLVSALRRLATVLVIAFEALSGRATLSKDRLIITAMLFLSLAAASSLSPAFDGLGVLLSIVSAVATAGNLIVTKSRAKELDSTSQLFLTSSLSIPFFAFAFFLSGEYDGVVEAFSERATRIGLGLLFSGGLSLFINLGMVWCTRVNTPLSTCLVGISKDVLLFVIAEAFDYVLKKNTASFSTESSFSLPCPTFFGGWTSVSSLSLYWASLAACSLTGAALSLQPFWRKRRERKTNENIVKRE